MKIPVRLVEVRSQFFISGLPLSTMHDVSVVIPTYNRREILGRALKSVFSQTLAPSQVIVVDDGSTDDTPLWLKRNYPFCEIVALERNRGVAHARNRGAQTASGTWIAFLDSDDEWFPNKIEKQLHFLTQETRLQASVCAEKWQKEGLDLVIPPFFRGGDHLLERSLERCVLSTSSLMVRRSWFLHGGGYDETLTICEDYRFFIEALLQGVLGYLDETLVRRHGGRLDQLSTIHRFKLPYQIQALESILQRQNKGPTHEKALILEQLRKKARSFIKGASLGTPEEARAGELRNKYIDL